MPLPIRSMKLCLLLTLIMLIVSACGSTPAAQPEASTGTATEVSAAASTDSGATEASAAASTEASAAGTEASTAATEASTAAGAEASAAGEGSQEPLIVLQGVDATTLDPHYSGSLPGANIMNHMFDRLTTQGIDGELLPMLATEWNMREDDQKVWEFKLNPDAKFSDGEPVTADDVIFTWKRSTDPANEVVGNTQYLLNNMKITNIEAPDPQTVVITTEKPSVTLPGFLAEYYILPQHYYEGLAREEASLKPLGSGPFVLQEWVKDDHLTMVRNPDYWGEPPAIEQIIWRPVPEAATRIAELLSGGADLIDNLPPDKTAEVEEAGLSTATVDTGRRIFVGITQYNNPALQDKRVRQALNHAVDFDAISAALLNGKGKRAGSNVNPPWQNSEVQPYAYDPEQAKALLAEAGWTDSDGNGFVDKDGEELKLTFDSPNGRYIKDIDIAQAVGQFLLDAGVNVEVAPQEWSNYVTKLDAKELSDLYLIGSGSNFEGQADISDLEANSSSNYGQWKNDQFQTLFGQLQGELEAEKRQELLNEMQVLVNDEAPYIFLYFQVAFYGLSDRLADWKPYPNERMHFENVTLR